MNQFRVLFLGDAVSRCYGYYFYLGANHTIKNEFDLHVVRFLFNFTRSGRSRTWFIVVISIQDEVTSHKV